MGNYREQLEKILTLRKERNDCEERLYYAKLNRKKLDVILQRMGRKETVLGNKKKIANAHAKLVQSEAKLQELNRQINAANDVLERSREIVRRCEYLKERVSATEKKLKGAKADAELKSKARKTDKTAILELVKKRDDLRVLLSGLKRDTAKASKLKERISPVRREASKRMRRLNLEQKRLQLSILRYRKQSVVAASSGRRQGVATEEKAAKLRRAYKRSKGNFTASYERLQKAIEELYPKPHPREVITELNDGIPFLMFPVRLETKFVSVESGAELWVRIYPDDISIHTHEKLLTDEEVREGIKYWKELFRAEKAGGDQKEARKKSAWSYIVSLFGPQRSAWIAREAMPANWSSDLTEIDNEDQLIFPVHEQTKKDSWSRAPRTNTMPDKFVVMLYEGDKIVREEIGNVIPDELYVGPDPLEPDASFQTKDEKLVFGESFDWTSDFDKAVQVGMGFRIPLTPAQASAGFDKVLVLGVYLSADETASKLALEELIDNHHYSPKGFSLVQQGMATNNTDEDNSGYRKNDQFTDISYFVETGPVMFNEGMDCDGRNLADALGIEIEYDKKEGPLQHVFGSDGRDYQDAVSMNKCLYEASLGYFCGTLLAPVFDTSTLDTLRNFNVNHVTGRGPLPALRVGNQPYGILLTSDFGRWWDKRDPSRDGVFLSKLYAVLFHYQRIWDGLVGQLKYVGKPGEDPSKVLMNILGLQAGSVSYYQRVGFSTDYLKNLDEFQWGGKHWQEVEQHYSQKGRLLELFRQFGYGAKNEEGQLVVPQGFRLVYQPKTTILDPTNVVDTVPLSERDPVRPYDEINGKNYLHWLAETSSIDKLEGQDFGLGKSPPNALLYLTLRRALLLQLHQASVGWFKKHNISLEYTLRTGNFYNIRPQGDLTKFEVMRARVGAAVPQDPHATMAVSEYLLTDGKDEEEAKYLRETRAALSRLARTSTAKLERCFTEHLDVCTYRLDAWQTGLFRLRLLRQRNVLYPEDREKRTKGIYLGAYGWLANIKPAACTQVAIGDIPEKLRPVSSQETVFSRKPVSSLESISVARFEAVMQMKFADEVDRRRLEACFTKDPSGKSYNLKKGLSDVDRAALASIFRPIRSYAPVFQDANSGGFVHAPSLNQASAAAVLRSGYLSHSDIAHPDLMAVNLSSERVRRALFVLQGIRNGQTLEALLGYQFERGMHDRASADERLKKLNLYIYDFRDAFPIHEHFIKQQGTTDGATESLPATNVINGVDLAESSTEFPFGASGAVREANDDERKAIEQERNKLQDTLDAVKDLLLAESTYQMVQGNPERAAAVLNALRDAHIPPELDVINTPRSSSLNFTQRVTLQFDNADSGSQEDNPWDPILMTPRANMESGVNKWLGKVLGAPDKISYRVACLTSDDHEIPDTVVDMTVEDLDLQPIDLVYIAGNELNTGAAQMEQEARTASTELECRIAHAYRIKHAPDEDAITRIQFLKPEGKKTLGQILPLLRMVKSLIMDSRPLNAVDFDPPSKERIVDKDNPKGYGTGNLKGRIESCLTSFESRLQELTSIAIDAIVIDTTGISHHCFTLKDAFDVMSVAKVTFEDLGSLEFSEREFRDAYQVSRLCDALRLDGIVIVGDTIGDLNGVLQMAGFFGLVTEKHGEQSPTQGLEELKHTYEDSDDQNDLKQLNRTTMEEFYPQATPKCRNQNGIVRQFEEISELHDVLVRLSKFGLSDMFPRLIIAFNIEDKVVMLEQARRGARAGSEALMNAEDLKGKGDSASDVQAKIDNYISAGKSLLGESFNIIPLFTYHNEVDIQQSNSDRRQLLKYATDTLGMILPVDEWIQNVSPVRPRIARWDYVRTLVETLNDDTLELKPIQLPFRANDSWLALEFPELYEITDPVTQKTSSEPFTIVHDTISLTVHGETAFAPGSKQGGLLIDDWTEQIPTKEEITGITFNYNRPNTCPPQTLLLAVTPQEKGHWTWEDLVGILNDTLSRAKRRAVEPILLDTLDRPEVNVLLPTLVADFTQYDLNVSLDYQLNVLDATNTTPRSAAGGGINPTT